MKKQQLLFYLALIMSIMTIQAQNTDCENNLLLNGDFSNSTCGGSSAFQTACVPNWTPSAGSPSLHGYPSNPFAWLWSHAGTGESISGGFNFIAGTTYTISFRIMTDGVSPHCTRVIANNSEIFMVATNSAGAVTSTPTGDIIVNQPSSAYLGSWVNVTTTFTPTANYSQLWIYPYKQIYDQCQVNLSIDDICIKLAPNNQGAYCCEGENLVDNGNFENGLNGITTSYTQTGATYPGEYDVVTTASNFNASVTDHSFCEDPTLYATNDSFMVVNGKTQQPSGTSSVIWEQTMNIEAEKNYKLCANFKNMPQCTFDILPEIRFEINGVFYPWTTINTDATDSCDWQKISECFSGRGDKTTIKIHLKEDGNGDGNDIAIDDISVQQKLDQNLNITVQHQGNPQQVIASINTINTSDDATLIGQDCVGQNGGNEYYWFVYELTSYPFNAPIDFMNMAPNSFSWSSNLGGFNSQLPISVNPGWSLTTTFPNYTFENNKLYVIGMYVPSCCESCYDEGWTYQLTLNGARSSSNFDTVFTAEVKDQLKSMFREFDSTTSEINNDTGSVSIYPNPVGNQLNISSNSTMKAYEIHDLLGKRIIRKVTNSKQVDISNLKNSLYFITVETETGEKKTIKFIKK